MPIFASKIAAVLHSFEKRGITDFHITLHWACLNAHFFMVKPKKSKHMRTNNTIANAQLNDIIDSYNGETRDWWNLVNEDAIYEAIGEHEFEVYVRLFGAEDAHYRCVGKAV